MTEIYKSNTMLGMKVKVLERRNASLQSTVQNLRKIIRQKDIKIIQLSKKKAIKGAFTKEILIEAVCEAYEVQREDIFGRSRKKEVIPARHCFQYILAMYTKESLKEIATYCKRIDHTSILHVRDKVSGILEGESQESKRIKNIIKNLGL